MNMFVPLPHGNQHTRNTDISAAVRWKGLADRIVCYGREGVEIFRH